MTQLTRLSETDFKQRLRQVLDLQQTAHRAYQSAAGAVLKFAVCYSELYQAVARDSKRVKRRNDSLGLQHFAGSRLRSIAKSAEDLKRIQKHLPPALEPMYEVTRALKRDRRRVLAAIKREELGPESTLRDVRALAKPINALATYNSQRDADILGRPELAKEVYGGRYLRRIKDCPSGVSFTFAFPSPDGRPFRTSVLLQFMREVQSALSPSAGSTAGYLGMAETLGSTNT